MISYWAFIGLRDQPRQTNFTKVNIIIDAVVDSTGITFDEISSRSRTRRRTDARHLFHWFCRHRTKLSLSEIGSITGRDHSSVLHSMGFVDDLKHSDKFVMNQITNIEHLIVRIPIVKGYGKRVETN